MQPSVCPSVGTPFKQVPPVFGENWSRTDPVTRCSILTRRAAELLSMRDTTCGVAYPGTLGTRLVTRCSDTHR